MLPYTAYDGLSAMRAAHGFDRARSIEDPGPARSRGRIRAVVGALVPWAAVAVAITAGAGLG